MRGSKVKKLRSNFFPHPGRKFGGTPKQIKQCEIHDDSCLCGCGADDTRCDLWKVCLSKGMEVPSTHICCKVYN